MSEQNNGIYVNCPYCDTATLISGLDLNKGQIFTGAKLCDQLNGCGGVFSWEGGVKVRRHTYSTGAEVFCG